MRTVVRSFLLLAILAASAPSQTPAAPPALAIAAASNLTYALAALDAAYTQAHPEVGVTSVTGASGNLVTQIRNGAPFDVFLSADLDFAQKLIQAGGAAAPSLRTFAVGRLVLWTTKPGLELNSIAGVVANPQVQKLAIANPRTAPYGLAAQQALQKLQLWTAAQPKLVQGENISQTAEFVQTGNADAGFVALALVLSPKLKDHGRYLEVPAELYAPLGQAAVLTRRGAANPSAQSYLDFLGSAPARAILEQYGYRLP